MVNRRVPSPRLSGVPGANGGTSIVYNYERKVSTGDGKERGRIAVTPAKTHLAV